MFGAGRTVRPGQKSLLNPPRPKPAVPDQIGLMRLKFLELTIRK